MKKIYMLIPLAIIMLSGCSFEERAIDDRANYYKKMTSMELRKSYCADLPLIVELNQMKQEFELLLSDIERDLERGFTHCSGCGRWREGWSTITKSGNLYSEPGYYETTKVINTKAKIKRLMQNREDFTLTLDQLNAAFITESNACKEGRAAQEIVTYKDLIYINYVEYGCFNEMPPVVRNKEFFEFVAKKNSKKHKYTTTCLLAKKILGGERGIREFQEEYGKRNGLNVK
jgi:hypothetical protein